MGGAGPPSRPPARLPAAPPSQLWPAGAAASAAAALLLGSSAQVAGGSGAACLGGACQTGGGPGGTAGRRWTVQLSKGRNCAEAGWIMREQGVRGTGHHGGAGREAARPPLASIPRSTSRPARIRRCCHTTPLNMAANGAVQEQEPVSWAVWNACSWWLGDARSLRRGLVLQPASMA